MEERIVQMFLVWHSFFGQITRSVQKNLEYILNIYPPPSKQCWVPDNGAYSKAKSDICLNLLTSARAPFPAYIRIEIEGNQFFKIKIRYQF